jgi:hypothetical protein
MSETNSERILAAVVHRFNDSWSLRLTGEGNRSTSQNWEYYPTYNASGGGIYNYGYNDFYRSTWTYDIYAKRQIQHGSASAHANDWPVLHAGAQPEHWILSYFSFELELDESAGSARHGGADETHPPHYTYDDIAPCCAPTTSWRLPTG